MMSILSVGDIIRIRRSCIEFTKRLAASEFPEIDAETLQRVVNSDLVVQCASAGRYVYASDDSGTCIRVAEVHAEIVSRLPDEKREERVERALNIGDIVKLKRAITVDNDTGEQVYIDTEERFVVIGEFKYNVMVKYLDRSNHGDELLLGRRFLEVVDDAGGAKLKRSLGEVTLNEGKGKMPKGTVVKIGVNDLADAREWTRSELSSDERFTVVAETTKTVFIKANERELLIRLPKRFLEEVTPEQIELNEQDILALIDIAIDTGDKDWFNELHERLSALE